jgi:hypothetical protein
MTIKKAILRSFNATTYTATVEISGSSRTWLEGVTVARNLPSAEMQTSRKLAVIFFDEHNVKDAVVTAVYV